MTTTVPHLTTGWEPDLGDADSLCLRWVRHWAAQCAAFAEAAGGSVVRDERYLLADVGRPAAFLNAAVLLAPVEDLAGLLDESEARTTGGAGEVYLWSLWPTPDLRARSWELAGHPPLCARPPLSVLPLPVLPLPDAQRGPEPERVRSPGALAAWERVLVDGYPLDDVALTRPGALVGPGLLDDARLRLWTSHDGDAPVAVSAQFVAHGVASFALAATVPTARRHGHWWRHAQLRLRAEPDLWHVGVFSDFSRPGAERLGFVPVLRHTLWHRTR
ncbi:MAG: hypothetical protein ACT4RN_15370 [Pseudonocardia sp.]